MNKQTMMVLALVTTLVACGDDEEEKKPAKTNDQNAKDNGKQQTTAIYDAMDGNGANAADKLFSAGGSSQGTVTAQSFTGNLGTLTLTPQADPPGCGCTGKTCTFTSCTRGASTLNGSLSADNGKFTADLTWETDGSGGTGLGSATKIHVKADLTVTDTSIKGTYHTDGNVSIKGLNLPNVPGVSAAAGNVSWTNEATWDVTTANKQPTAGSIQYSGTYTTSQGVYAGTGSATFPLTLAPREIR